MQFKTSKGTYLSYLGNTRQRGAQNPKTRSQASRLIVDAHDPTNSELAATQYYEMGIWEGFDGITAAPCVLRYVPPSRKIQTTSQADVNHIARSMRS